MSRYVILHDPATGDELAIPEHRITEVRAVTVGAVLELWTESRVYVRETPDQVKRARRTS